MEIVARGSKMKGTKRERDKWKKEKEKWYGGDIYQRQLDVRMVKKNDK